MRGFAYERGKKLERTGCEKTGLVLVSSMPLRNADAKRPGMHSNAKRWNEAGEAVRGWPK